MAKILVDASLDTSNVATPIISNVTANPSTSVMDAHTVTALKLLNIKKRASQNNN